MKEPKWLLQSVIETIHDMQIAEHGGLSGIRDAGLLESSLARAKNLYEYDNANLFDLASAYAFALVRNHPFNDGNKRTAFLAAYIFLANNGINFNAAETETTAIIISLAAGEINQPQFAQWLKSHATQTQNH